MQDISTSLMFYTQLTPRFYCNYKSLLGQGNYGSVHLGYDIDRKNPIAVKFIPTDRLICLGDKANREKQIMEVCAADCMHPNIVGYFGTFDNLRGRHYFLELVEGGSLDKAIQRGLTEEQVVKIFMGLLQAMTFLNDKNIFHRDLKPQNILLTKDMSLKLADFGIARNLLQGVQYTSNQCTPLYAAPEQRQSRLPKSKYTQKCDVFSAGYILYEMLVGRRLTQHIKTFLQLDSFHSLIKKEGVRFQYPKHLSPYWTPFTARMFQFQASKRPAFRQLLRLFKRVKPMILDGKNKNKAQNDKIKISQIDLNQVQEEMILQEIEDIGKTAICEVTEKRQLICCWLYPCKLFTLQLQNVDIPNIYRWLLMFSSLSVFISHSGQTIQELKQAIYAIEKHLCQLKADMKENYKLRIKQKGQEFINKINQQIKAIQLTCTDFLPILLQIITNIQSYKSKSDTQLQQALISELMLQSDISLIKQGKMSESAFYRSVYTSLSDNLYETPLELAQRSLDHLRVYYILISLPKSMTESQVVGLSTSMKDILSINREKIISMIKY